MELFCKNSSRTQVFSREIGEIFKNTCFEEHLGTMWFGWFINIHISRFLLPQFSLLVVCSLFFSVSDWTLMYARSLFKKKQKPFLKYIIHLIPTDPNGRVTRY